MDPLAPFDVAAHLGSDEITAEFLVACLEHGDPDLVAGAVRTIMRSRGEEPAGEPTIADFLAITKRFGFTVRADGDSWGIGPYPDYDEFEKRHIDPRFNVPTLEHEGYIALLEVDVNASLIRGRFVNADSFPDFFGQTVDGAKAAFREIIRQEKEQDAKRGRQSEHPQPTKLPPLLPTQFDEWFPNLSKTRGDLPIIFRCMNYTLGAMRKHGFLEEQSATESRQLAISDYQAGLGFIYEFIGCYSPMPTKISWVIWRLSDELNLIASGLQPQFLRPAVYSGTKTRSPKYRALRRECAYTVASLMRRGMNRDDACKDVANLLSEMKLSSKKNGSFISARTILSFYDAIRKEAEHQGKPIRNIFSDANTFLIRTEIDNEYRDPAGKGKDYPEPNGLPPLEALRDRLEVLLPIV
jgi:hypothetical protein